MFMLHKVAENKGWTHDYMMNLPKPIFYRYYGYWYQDNLRKEEEYRKQEQKNKTGSSGAVTVGTGKTKPPIYGSDEGREWKRL